MNDPPSEGTEREGQGGTELAGNRIEGRFDPIAREPLMTCTPSSNDPEEKRRGFDQEKAKTT